MTVVKSIAPNRVESLFHLLRRLGLFVGCRLFCCDSSKKLSEVGRFFKTLVFIAVIAFYAFCLVIVISSCVPTANDTQGFQFDIRTAFALVWTLLIVDGLGCFITMNYASHVLERKDGFFIRYEDNFSKEFIPSQSLKRWKRFTIGTIAFGAVTDVKLAIIGTLNVTGVLSAAFPINFDRASEWTSMPRSAVMAIAQLGAFTAAFHIEYQCILYSSLCDIVRRNFSVFCDRLEQETSNTFSSSKIGWYQSGYSLLAEVVECLDDAFKHSCLCQLVIFMGTASLNAFIYAKGYLEYDTTITVVYFSLLMFVEFVYTGVPAMLLKAEVGSGWTLRFDQSSSGLLHFRPKNQRSYYGRGF